MDKWEYIIWRAILSGLVNTKEKGQQISFLTKDDKVTTFNRSEGEWQKAVKFLKSVGVNLPGVDTPWR